MHQKICSSPHYDKWVKFSKLLKDQFGINHFWYYKITYSGHYSYMGTHAAWSEFCYSNNMTLLFPCLAQPDELQPGIILMKASSSEAFKNVLDTAWSKFGINFNLNIQSRIPEGIEAYGFATQYNGLLAEQRLLKELPLLNYFTKVCRRKYGKLFELLDETQVELFKQSKPRSSRRDNFDRHEFFEKMGNPQLLSLTSREKDVIKYLAHGFPASYIAEQLFLSQRTIETHVTSIKQKLNCDSKVELIQLAKEFTPILDFFPS